MSTARNKVKRLFFSFLHAPILCVSTCHCNDFARVNSVVELHSPKFLNSGKCKSRGECVEFQCFHHQGCSQVLLFPPPLCTVMLRSTCTAATKKKFFFKHCYSHKLQLTACFLGCRNEQNGRLFLSMPKRNRRSFVSTFLSAHPKCLPYFHSPTTT